MMLSAADDLLEFEECLEEDYHESIIAVCLIENNRFKFIYSSPLSR